MFISMPSQAWVICPGLKFNPNAAFDQSTIIFMVTNELSTVFICKLFHKIREFRTNYFSSMIYGQYTKSEELMRKVCSIYDWCPSKLVPRQNTVNDVLIKLFIHVHNIVLSQLKIIILGEPKVNFVFQLLLRFSFRECLFQSQSCNNPSYLLLQSQATQLLVALLNLRMG